MNNESYIEMLSNEVLKLCSRKWNSIDFAEQQEIENFIRDNIKPERKGWFKIKPPVSRKQAEEKLNETDYLDPWERTHRESICAFYNARKNQVNLIKSMAESVPTVWLSSGDYKFLTDI